MRCNAKLELGGPRKTRSGLLARLRPTKPMLLLAVFIPTVAGLGALIGWWLADRERAMQVLLFTSLPLAFLGGFSWPAEALPTLLERLRWLSPSTAAIKASLQLNQMGAPVEAALFPLSILLSLALVAVLALLWVGRGRSDGASLEQSQATSL